MLSGFNLDVDCVEFFGSFFEFDRVYVFKFKVVIFLDLLSFEEIIYLVIKVRDLVFVLMLSLSIDFNEGEVFVLEGLFIKVSVIVSIIVVV